MKQFTFKSHYFSVPQLLSQMVLILGSTLGSVIYSQVEDAGSLSLSQAIEEGLTHSPDHQVAQNAHRMALNDEILGTSRLFPTVDARARTVYQNQKALQEGAPARGDFDSYSNSVGLGLSWVLFDGLQTFKAKSIVEQEAKLSEFSLESSERLTIMQIKLLYAKTSVSFELANWWSEQYQTTRNQFQKSEEKFNSGAMTKREWLKAKILMKKDSISLVNQTQQFKTSWVSLSELIGRESSQIPKFDLFELAELQNIPSLDLNQNLEFQELKVQEKIALESKEFAKGSYYPRLIGFGNYDYIHKNSEFSDLRQTNENLLGEVGLALSWNIFDGLQSTMEFRNAQLSLENVKIKKSYYQAKVSNEFQILKDDIQIGRDNLILAQEQSALSQEHLTLTLESYQIGGLTRLEYEDALLESRLAKITLKNAEIVYYEKSLKLLYLCGK